MTIHSDWSPCPYCNRKMYGGERCPCPASVRHSGTPKQLTLDRAVEPPYVQEVQVVVKYTLSLSTNNTREQYRKWAERRLRAANPFHHDQGAPPEILSIKEEHELYGNG